MDLTVDGINWIVAIQSLGAWLELPMRFFTFLGYENFFFIVLPFLYWSVDTRLGLRVGLVLLSGTFLNAFFKLAFALPRPYWVSSQVYPYSSDPTFGLPSAHAQNAVAQWGIIADAVHKRWAWILATLLAFLIGFSRLYLGVHFVWDVIAGWLLGGILLWTFLRFWDPVADWISRQGFARQVLYAAMVSLIIVMVGAWQVARLDGYTLPQEWIDNAQRSGELPDPISLNSFLTSAGTIFGLAMGAAWTAAGSGYQTSGPLEKRVMRYIVGVIGILILWMGLGQVFPRNPDLISYILRFFRYFLVGLWITAGAPWLFFRFKLADEPKM